MISTGNPDSDSTITSTEGAQALASGTLLAGRYRIESLLGIGGMGMVYRAIDQSLDVPVALKLLRPELSSRPEAFERFRQEVLLARQVSSPHVLRIHDIARDGARWFISMDLIEGDALDRMIAQNGRLPVEQAVQIGQQVALGLAAAHQQGVVHRDLKPSNVLIDASGQARIADFGIARSLGSSGLTQAGAVVGTPDYLSPEQARGLPVDARSDLYALGLLLFEMLTAQLPFAAQTTAESLSQRIGGYIIPLRKLRPDAPPWLERLLGRLLRPQPAQRLQHAEHVALALQERRMAVDWRPSRRALLAVAALLLLLIPTLLWWSKQPATLALPSRVERVLLLPIEANQLMELDAAMALADQLRRELAASGEVAVVGSERSLHTFERVGANTDTPAQRASLREELPTTRLLRVTLNKDLDVYRAEVALYSENGPRLQLRPANGDSPVAAALALLPQLHRGLDVVSEPTDVLARAAPVTALSALGRGIEHRLRGRIDAAIAEFDAALAADPGLLSAAMALAETGIVAGDPAVAARALQAAGKIAQNRSIGPLQILQAQHQADWEAAEHALKQRLERIPDDVASYWALAEVLAARGDLGAAERALHEGLQRDAGDPRGWFLRGKFAILRGDIRPAVDNYLVRAVLLNKRDRNRFGEAESVNALGVAYARLGQVQDAEEQYRRALSLRQSIGHQRGVASSLRNLAQLAMIQGRRDEAATTLDQARSIFDQLGDRAGLSAVDNELGLLAEESGDFTRALEAYRQALRSRESLGDRLGVAESLNNIGFAQFQRGDYDSARVFWQQSLEAFDQLGDLGGRIRAQQNLGLLDIVRGRWQDALSLLQESLKEAEAQQLAEESAVSRRNLAELDLLRGDLVHALEHLSAAADQFEARGDLRGSIDVRLLRARAALLASHADAADAALSEAEADIDQASPEQQAMAALLRADLAQLRDDATSRGDWLQKAEAPAQASGVRALQLAIQSRAQPLRDGLEGELRAFGHRPLWLGWLENALRASIISKTPDPRYYEEALNSLSDTPDYVGAGRLHRLGAQLYQSLGDADGAAQAGQRANTHLNDWLPSVPTPWQDSARNLGVSQQ